MDGFKTAKYPKFAKATRKLAEDFNPTSYQLTFVPGESEFVSHLLGLPMERKYRNLTEFPDRMPSNEAFKDTTIWKRMEKQYMEIDTKDPADYAAEEYWRPQDSTYTYTKEESPLLYLGEDRFAVNPESEHGKEFQRRINYAYTTALNKGPEKGMDINPDTGKLMYKGEEDLLGDIYFNESGQFEDKWNISLDEYEPIGTPVNLFRMLSAPLLERNIPKVLGEAKYIGEE